MLTVTHWQMETNFYAGPPRKVPGHRQRCRGAGLNPAEIGTDVCRTRLADSAA
jgi:hypothetical protein